MVECKKYFCFVIWTIFAWENSFYTQNKLNRFSNKTLQDWSLSFLLHFYFTSMSRVSNWFQFKIKLKSYIFRIQFERTHRIFLHHMCECKPFGREGNSCQQKLQSNMQLFNNTVKNILANVRNWFKMIFSKSHFMWSHWARPEVIAVTIW